MIGSVSTVPVAIQKAYVKNPSLQQTYDGLSKGLPVVSKTPSNRVDCGLEPNGLNSIAQRSRKHTELEIASAKLTLVARQKQMQSDHEFINYLPQQIGELNEQLMSAGPDAIDSLRRELDGAQSSLFTVTARHASLTVSWPDFKIEMEANIARWQAELDAS